MTVLGVGNSGHRSHCVAAVLRRQSVRLTIASAGEPGLSRLSLRRPSDGLDYGWRGDRTATPDRQLARSANDFLSDEGIAVSRRSGAGGDEGIAVSRRSGAGGDEGIAVSRRSGAGGDHRLYSRCSGR
jgi:hypothetical protein